MTEGQIIISVLYGLIGATGALSIVVFVWGFITYIMRLGTVRREEGIRLMGWGVRFVITSIILIGVLRLVQHWFGVS